MDSVIIHKEMIRERIVHPQFAETVEKVAAWAREDGIIFGIVIIGSQARVDPPSDQWSDLDLMVLVKDPQPLLNDSAWLGRFGQVVCFFEEIVPLQGFTWNWHVKRVLYDDNRDVDFSVLPYDHLDEVLLVNKDILSKGFRVIYDTGAEPLDQKIAGLLQTAEDELHLPTEGELRNVVSDLLFHVVWAFKKIKRQELWVAVSCINSYMKGHLLWLIEAYDATMSQTKPTLAYNGRYLEQRTNPEVLRALQGCFSRYDAAEAVETLGHLIDVTRSLSQAICERNGYPFDAAPFERITTIYCAMKENEPYEHP